MKAQYLKKSFKFLRRFINLTHDSKHTPKAKFQNQWSLTICCHSLKHLSLTLSKQKTLFLLNMKVRQLTDLKGKEMTKLYKIFYYFRNLIEVILSFQNVRLFSFPVWELVIKIGCHNWFSPTYELSEVFRIIFFTESLRITVLLYSSR